MSSSPTTKKDLPPNGMMAANRSDSQVDIEMVDDSNIRDFYAGAISDKYRLKSEIVAKHLADTGMGK